MEPGAGTFGRRLRAALAAGGMAAALGAAMLAAPAGALGQPASTPTPAPTATPTTTKAPTPAEPMPIKGRQIHGLVKKGSINVGAMTFVVETAKHGEVTVHFAGAPPRARGPRTKPHQASSVSDLRDGDRVVVQGRLAADGKTFEARRVHVLPAKKTAHAVGTVEAATATSLTVKLADGTTKSFTLSADTKLRPPDKTLADLTPGAKVTVVARDGTASAIVLRPS